MNGKNQTNLIALLLCMDDNVIRNGDEGCIVIGIFSAIIQ